MDAAAQLLRTGLSVVAACTAAGLGHPSGGREPNPRGVAFRACLRARARSRDRARAQQRFRGGAARFVLVMEAASLVGALEVEGRCAARAEIASGGVPNGDGDGAVPLACEGVR